ncbi:hypothetical protein SCHPADRAFT_932254 [Schizopora paradoxa]|uniref:F-box domain-containing protein n=1 Tax=Schizopora paradoxa TaxID=27342 RepID=A0A0H2RS90_9AGAM|nr:hypothetical protein SCHPADRAFT_932254 [Schizopora paradoxa]
MVKVLDTGECPQENQEEIAVAQEENTSIASMGRCDFDSVPSEVLAQILELVVESAWRDGPRRSPTWEEMGTFPREEGLRDDSARPTASGDGEQRILSYPTLLLLVCRRWFAIVLDTPMIWSFLSLTDDSTLDKISLSLERSKSSLLSIRFSYLTRMTKNDEFLLNFKHLTSSCVKVFDCLVDGVPVKTLGKLDTKIISSNDSLIEKMSLILQHAERWARFLFSATQPRFVHQTASMVRSNNFRMRFLVEFGLQSVLTCENDFDFMDESAAKQQTFWLDSAIPSLRKMALARCRFPDSISSHSVQELFPALAELEIAQMEGRSFASLLKLLDGLPQLRALTIIQTLCTRDRKYREQFGGLYRRPVVLGSLEELTIKESNAPTLEHVFNLVSVPNVQSLSLIGTGLYNAFASAIKKFELLPNLRKLRLEGVWLEYDEPHPFWDRNPPNYKAMERLFSAMPNLTSIHLDSKLRAYTALLDQPSSLLPDLTEISLSGWSGDLIGNIMGGRDRSGFTVETLRLDKGAIVSGAVTSGDWSYFEYLVETLCWFDCDTEVDYDSFKLSQSAIQRASQRYVMMANYYDRM